MKTPPYQRLKYLLGCGTERVLVVQYTFSFSSPRVLLLLIGDVINLEIHAKHRRLYLFQRQDFQHHNISGLFSYDTIHLKKNEIA